MTATTANFGNQRRPSTTERDELREVVGLLRDDLREMQSFLRELSRDRASLAAELREIRQRQQPEWRRKAQRVQTEVDELSRMYEAATAKRRERPDRRAPRLSRAHAPRDREDGGDRDSAAMMRRMMMAVMMAELMP